jgi:hypothetical protein
VLLIICLFTTISRLYIRVFVQREFTIDDGLILVGFCCLVAGLVLFYTIAEEQFLVSDLTYNKVEALFRAPPNWLDQVMDYEKQVITSLLCTWAAIVCVKMSFIFFFRKLVERIRSMMIFWWVVLLFNVGVCGYGFSVYVLACPERESINLTQSCKFSIPSYYDVRRRTNSSKYNVDSVLKPTYRSNTPSPKWFSMWSAIF